MKRQLNLIIILLLFFSVVISAQQPQAILVTGQVVDDTGEPLMGLNIAVKDQVGRGTITDIDGNYSLQVIPYSTLIFSYIGYQRQEINITDKKVINVIMKTDNILDEVVVTAAGVEKKISSTGAITTVNLEDLRVSSPNLSNSLAGNVPGILARQASGEPGQNQSEFWIRGISTFGANQSALVLVDGFERDFDEINIEDIESFSVLKDASATAIYGSKGANGVILITTKKGKIEKVNIKVKAEYSYKTLTRTPEFVGGLGYAEMMNEALVTRNYPARYTNEEIEIIRYQLDPDFYPDVDWMGLMLNDGASSYKASVSLQGGGSAARYYVSGGYLEEGGMYKVDQALKEYNTNANYNRWNYRMNFDMDITPTTLVHVGVSGYLSKKNEPGAGNNLLWRSLIGMNPVAIPVLYSDGKYSAYSTNDYQANPWMIATQTGYKEYWKSTSEVNLTLKQDLEFITKGLRFEARTSLDNINENTIERRKRPETWRIESDRRDLNGELSFKKAQGQKFLTQDASSGGIRKFSIEAELHYRKIFANKHRVSGLVKYHQNEKKTTVDLGSNMIKGIPFRNMGVSGKATYSFMDRYLLEANFGYTGSETFMPGHQFGFFPAISGAWNLGEEEFIKKAVPWLSIAKIRYSYGLVGNDYIGENNTRVRFPYISSINRTDENDYKYTFSDIGESTYRKRGIYFGTEASEGLTWEVAKKHNLGLDVNVLNGLFSMSFDVFKDIREDIFKRREYLPRMVGVGSNPWSNVGKMESKGYDGHFGFSPRIGEVKITLRGNVTYAKNEILDYDEEANSLPYRMTKGYRYKQKKGLIALGLFEDYDDIRNSPKQTFGEYAPGDIKYKDVNGDGIIDGEDQVAIGATSTPNLVYGMGLSVQWKGFDFNVHFQGAGNCSQQIQGSSIWPFSYRTWGNIYADAADPNNRWISREISGTPDTERTDAKYPRLSFGGKQNDKGDTIESNNYRSSSFWLRDMRYLRFKTLEVGYTVPRKSLSMLGVSSARIFFLGNNLALWDNFKLWDPELDTDNGQKYPVSRSFTVGLSVSF